MPSTQENFRVGELFTYDNGGGIVEVHSVQDRIGVVGVDVLGWNYGSVYYGSDAIRDLFTRIPDCRLGVGGKIYRVTQPLLDLCSKHGVTLDSHPGGDLELGSLFKLQRRTMHGFIAEGWAGPDCWDVGQDSCGSYITNFTVLTCLVDFAELVHSPFWEESYGSYFNKIS